MEMWVSKSGSRKGKGEGEGARRGSKARRGDSPEEEEEEEKGCGRGSRRALSVTHPGHVDAEPLHELTKVLRDDISDTPGLVA